MKIFDENQKLIFKLQKCGLTKKQTTVYLGLLELGGAFPSKVSDYVNMNRSTVYKILSDLSIKNLIVETKKRGKWFYCVEKPEKLLSHNKRRINILNKEIKSTENVLKDLNSLFSLNLQKPKIKFYEGVEGVLEVFRSHLNIEKPYEMLAVCNASKFLKFIPNKELKKYLKAKEKLEITTRGLVPDTNTDIKYNNSACKNAGVSKKTWPKLRFVSSEVFNMGSDITVYGEDKISIINFTNDKLIGIIIEDKTIHDMFKMVFNLAWKGAERGCLRCSLL